MAISSPDDQDTLIHQLQKRIKPMRNVKDVIVVAVITCLFSIVGLTGWNEGVERFNDPFAGKEVELPSGYGRAFANNLGEYIVTDSPSYNPNIGSNLHWEELKPAR